MSDASAQEDGPSAADDGHPEEGLSHIIRPGHHILLRLPTKEVRALHIESPPGDKTINLGKFGSFRQQCLVGQPFGLSYEIQADKSLVTVPPRRLEELEETGATNERIVDGGEFVQPLTFTEIETLKKSGLHASEIIKRQIETHANYEMKTEYSKDKYKKRKEAKFAKEITILPPTLFNVANYYFTKDPNKILNLRVDTLSQMMSLANLRPGARFMVVDGTGGLVVAAALDRLAGEGRVLYLSEVDSPPQFPPTNLMNLSEKHMSILQSLDWAAVDEEHVSVRAPTAPQDGNYRSTGQQVRYNKRKQAVDALEQIREDLFSGEWDGLLIAAQYEPFSIIERLTPYLAGSSTITIYSQYLPVLAATHAKMRVIPSYLSPSITEAWLRQYQVLPGRTHPMMNMTGGGGYILHAIRVYDDPKASSALVGFRKRVTERKTKAERGKMAAEGIQNGDAGEPDEEDSTKQTQDEDTIMTSTSPST